MLDLLFITRVSRNRDSCSQEVFRPLRMEVGGQVADLPALRTMARGGGGSPAAGRIARERLMPVLTPFYLEEYFRRRGISMEEIPCLEGGLEQVREHVRRGVRIIALCTTWIPSLGQAQAVREAARLLRAAAPGVPVIAGGMGAQKALLSRQLLEQGRMGGLIPGGLLPRLLPGPLTRHLVRRELVRHLLLLDHRLDGALDAVVTGENGEATLAAIVGRMRAGQDFRDLPNLAVPAAGGYRFNPERPETVDVDSETVDWTRYAPRLAGHEAPIRTGAGCPFECAFCDFPCLQKPRTRSLESIVAELHTLAAALPPPRKVYFVDDNLGLSRKRLLGFARAVTRERLDLAWSGFLRADVIDSETAGALRESGCRECLLGIESGDPGVLRNMNKRLDPERAMRGIEALDAEGIGTISHFVVGFPGEDARSVERTAAFISALPSGERAGAVHRYYLFRFIVAPLSPVAGAGQRERFGLTGIGENWRHRTMSADEARLAIRQIFMTVRGPSHLYVESMPGEWSASGLRTVLELRDGIQKDRLLGRDRGGLERLLQAVRAAEHAGQSLAVPVRA